MEAFAQHPDAVWPGQLGVDANGQPVLLDCNCVPTCQCCCPDGSERDQCGFCTVPPAVPPCVCTPELQAKGECIPCPPEATSQPDAVPVCLYITGSINLFQRVDVPRCEVEAFLLQHPGSVFPGFAGLDCWCQTPTPPPQPPCLYVYDGCPGTTVVYQSFMCLPLPNSSLSGLISCASSSMLEAWSCPFGCQSGCQLDPAVFDVLGLSRFTSPLLGTQGVCGPLPGLPNSLVQCIPGVCTPITTIPFTTTTTTSATGTTLSTAAPTTAPPNLPEGCLTASPGCTNGTAGNVASVDGVLCAVGFRDGTPFGFRMACDILGFIHVYACASLDCKGQCIEDTLWEGFLGTGGLQVGPDGVCAVTNLQIPGVGTTNTWLTCKPSCVNPIPPLVPPPNQVPPVFNRTNPPTTTSATPFTTITTVFTTASSTTSTFTSETSVTGSTTTGTTTGTTTTGTTTPTTTTTTTTPSTSSTSNGGSTTTTSSSTTSSTTSGVPLTSNNPNQNMGTNQVNLLAVVGVPMTVLAATVFIALFQQGRPEAPKYYPQSDW